MKNTEDLLRDLINSFKKYIDGKEFEALDELTQIRATVFKLKLPPNGEHQPAIMLVHGFFGSELWLTAKSPNEGANESFVEPTLKIETNSKGSKKLKIRFDAEFLSGEYWKNIRIFQIKLIGKFARLVYFGKYEIGRFETK